MDVNATHGPAFRGPCERGRRSGEAGSISLEIVLLMPVLTLLALFVLWAGRGGRAGLIAELAAEEAATVAALACQELQDAACDDLVADALSDRPSLDSLCIGGARADRPEGLVDTRWIRFHAVDLTTPGAIGDFEAAGVGLFSVQFLCETTGAVTPLPGLLSPVTFHGQAVEVAILPVPPGVRIRGADATEGEPLRFVVSFDAPAVSEVTLSYTVDAHHPATTTAGDCTASPQPDYQVPQPQTVTLKTGDTEATIEIPTCPDSIREADETIIVTLNDPLLSDPQDLASPPLVIIDVPEAIGTICDEDGP